MIARKENLGQKKHEKGRNEIVEKEHDEKLPGRPGGLPHVLDLHVGHGGVDHQEKTDHDTQREAVGETELIGPVKDGFDGIDGGSEFEIRDAVPFSDGDADHHAEHDEDRQKTHFLDFFQESFHQVDFPFILINCSPAAGSSQDPVEQVTFLMGVKMIRSILSHDPAVADAGYRGQHHHDRAVREGLFDPHDPRKGDHAGER